jgi:hypothetical protein
LILMDDFWRGKINREKIRLVPPSSFIFSRFYFYYFYYYWTKWLDFVFISGRPTWSLSLTRCDGRCNRTWCILRADNLLLDILFRRAETKIKNSRTRERERKWTQEIAARNGIGWRGNLRAVNDWLFFLEKERKKKCDR